MRRRARGAPTLGPIRDGLALDVPVLRDPLGALRDWPAAG